MKKENKPSLIEASIMLVIIIATIAIGVIALKIAPAIAILSAIGIVMIYTAVKRLSFETIHEGIVSGITPGIMPIFIFILVGSLIAVWIQAGIIPTLMVVGFKIISVKWFVPSVFVVCALVGSAVKCIHWNVNHWDCILWNWNNDWTQSSLSSGCNCIRCGFR